MSSDGKKFEEVSLEELRKINPDWADQVELVVKTHEASAGDTMRRKIIVLKSGPKSEDFLLKCPYCDHEFQWDGSLKLSSPPCIYCPKCLSTPDMSEVSDIVEGNVVILTEGDKAEDFKLRCIHCQHEFQWDGALENIDPDETENCSIKCPNCSASMGAVWLYQKADWL